MMQKVGIYIRVSKREQAEEGYSIPAQRRKLEAFCEVQEWKEFDFYIDEGLSAKDMNRPELKRLLTDVKEGKINILLVYRLDRLTRSVVDLYKILQELKDHDATFRSATEPYDTASSMGRMFIGLIALLAQWERENLSERVKFGKREKVLSGKVVSSHAPFGFRIEDETYKIDNRQSLQLLEMIDLYEKGASGNELSRMTKQRIDWHPMETADVLKAIANPALIGYGHHRGEPYPLKNAEKLITEERYEKILKLKEERSKKRNRKSKEPFIFRMKVKCPICGDAHLSGIPVSSTNEGTGRGPSYRCAKCKKNGRAFNVTEKKLENALIEYMQSVEHNKAKPTESKYKKDRVALKKEYDALAAKREKFTMSWAEGFTSKKEYKKLMDATKDRFEQLETILSTEEEKEIEKNKKSMAALVKAKFNDLWGLMTRKEKEEFCQTHIQSLYIHRGNRIVENGKSGFKITITDIDFYV
ncbi:recombinase family protein [Pseudobacillus badius]|uniref:recombinase family protein n=1 Tax=Bacillus badius TaxID=1455 RepID=UPI0007BB3CC7|nr:recombinase family protein [Bacillus badius]KZR58333.1 hypothetical protein A3781_17180 [Bacillus badius]